MKQLLDIENESLVEEPNDNSEKDVETETESDNEEKCKNEILVL